jgi:hypothetical protein
MAEPSTKLEQRESETQVGMKTEQKYFELTVFVFYIMNRFLTWKIVSFNWFHNHFNHFLYSLIAKYRNISNRPFSFFYIVSPFSTVSDRFHPCTHHVASGHTVSPIDSLPSFHLSDSISRLSVLLSWTPGASATHVSYLDDEYESTIYIHLYACLVKWKLRLQRIIKALFWGEKAKKICFYWERVSVFVTATDGLTRRELLAGPPPPSRICPPGGFSFFPHRRRIFLQWLNG